MPYAHSVRRMHTVYVYCIRQFLYVDSQFRRK